jgi:hypothetical protein
MNLIINLDKDDTLILPTDSDASLASFGIGAFSAPLRLTPAGNGVV